MLTHHALEMLRRRMGIGMSSGDPVQPGVEPGGRISRLMPRRPGSPIKGRSQDESQGPRATTPLSRPAAPFASALLHPANMAADIAGSGRPILQAKGAGVHQTVRIKLPLDRLQQRQCLRVEPAGIGIGATDLEVGGTKFLIEADDRALQLIGIVARGALGTRPVPMARLGDCPLLEA
jgi:hypothetical protein